MNTTNILCTTHNVPAISHAARGRVLAVVYLAFHAWLLPWEELATTLGRIGQEHARSPQPSIKDIGVVGASILVHPVDVPTVIATLAVVLIGVA